MSQHSRKIMVASTKNWKNRLKAQLTLALSKDYGSKIVLKVKLPTGYPENGEISVATIENEAQCDFSVRTVVEAAESGRIDNNDKLL